jgi:hypothetical protein
MASASLIAGGKYLSSQLPIKNNMQQLASLVNSANDAAEPAPRLVVYRQTRMFGLQFYLRRTLYRLTDTSQSSEYPAIIYNFHEFLNDHPYPLLAVARLRDLTDLESSAANQGWRFEEIERSKHWSTGRLLPPAVRPPKEAN